MATTPEDLTGFVGALPSEQAFVTSCLEESVALVDGFIGSTLLEVAEGAEPETFGPYKVPAVIRDKCILQTGANLYHQKAAKNGIVGFDDVENRPIRVARDPMLDSYPLLRRFIPVGLA